MAEKNQIGLDSTQAKELAQQLNDLLANYQVFYMNARGFHWNITGEKFFELHAKFEELYNDLIAKVDEIAERILTLGNTPVHGFSQYLQTAAISEAMNISDGKTAVSSILNSFKTLLQKERAVMKTAQEAGDEGTIAMMSGYIGQQEKMVWMYTAYLKP